MRSGFLYCFLAFAFLSCKKESESNPDSFPEIEAGNMVLVCSEGNFRWANAEAGLLNLRTGKKEWQAFQKKNGRPVGDVLQSAGFWNGKLWLVVNNSGRLEGLNTNSFTSESSISGLTSPRFLQAVSPEKAYLTDLYANKLWILKENQTTPAGSISMPGWTEELLMAGNKVWVLCRERPYILGINPQNDRVEDSLFLPGNGRSLCSGPDGKIWVGFEESAGSAPGLVLINLGNKQQEMAWFDDSRTSAPDRLISSAGGDTLYFLHQGLCRFVEGTLFRFPLESGNWYGLGRDPVRRELWLSDVRDYQQNSRILRLDQKGNKIQEYSGGIISSRFYFW